MPTTRTPDPGSPVIRRKITVPPSPVRLVVRERIDRLVGDLIDGHPLVWVCATAGSGKTTAVTQALARRDRRVAWLTLDDTDAAAGRLVTYLEAALAAVVPGAAGVATAALAARLPHAEAAGLLAEAVGEAPVVLVVDEVERIAQAPEALAVMGALVRYASPGLRIVMISRAEVDIALGSPAALGGAVTVSEADLAFRTHEAAQALAFAGRPEMDPSQAVEVTGGWVAGVLFEAWRSTQHVAGMGGEADALHGYLSSQILDQLSPEDREFLIATSVLDDVTAERAAALGEANAAARLASLRTRHLPVAWRREGHSLRCHARLREYLLERLERRGAEQLRQIRAAHAELLCREGHEEDAVEEFLRAGCPERALDAAQSVIQQVIDRLDYAVAERWLAAFKGLPGAGSTRLAVAEMMLALGREDYARCGRVADRLHMVSQRQRLARESPRAAGMMAWSYWHVGRWRDAEEVSSAAPDSPEMEAVRFTLNLVNHELAGARTINPTLSGSPLDALVIRVMYAHGRLRTLAEAHASGWTAAVTEPWRIGLLRATGHPEQALELYERTRVADWAHVWLHGIVRPEILIDLARADEARASVMEGRKLTRASGSLVFVMLNELIEAKMEIRLNGDPRASLAVLARLQDRHAASEYRFIGEAADVWTGLSLLTLGEDERALHHLERAVATMTASDRILELPTAAVYLSEARWRAGDEDGADAAADLAADAARRQGSNHYLLLALAAFPAVVTRRLDAELSADSPWHELGRALRAQGVEHGGRWGARVELIEFGTPAIVVDGEPTPRPRIAKSYELLAFLLSQTGHAAGRDELLSALFDGRSDESARAYLRQAVHQLREVLPAQLRLVSEPARTWLEDPVIVSSDSARLEAALAEAARLQGEDRIEATLHAIAVADRGPYLEGLSSLWIEERRDRLARIVLDARQDTAELCFAAGRYADAARQVETILAQDPFREGAHRLEMRIANATGDEDRVIAAYRRCERQLNALGTTPSTTTRRLLETLRR
jgi:ATP/maltotriose-dependent transcriptional regulator MalT/DNA-binding SARP family transcriptional activator